MDVDRPEEQLIDLEAYASNYSGHGKIDRLLFIANKTSSNQLQLEALRLAIDELKRGEDTAKYTEATNAAGGRLGSKYTYDMLWVEAKDRAAIRRQEALEAELNGYKSNLIKESIRLGHNELGNFCYARGNLQEAFKCYVRTRDYCTTSKHIWTTCLNAIRVSVELGNFNHVSTYVMKAEQTPDVKNQTEVVAKLTAASGLAYLDTKRYKQAARKFTEVNAELGSQWNEVIAPQDIALYGVICGLALFDRGELRRNIIDNVQFREYLEVYPEVRELVHDFYGSRYASCLQQLHRLHPVMNLDIHLSQHAATLCADVRRKALVQYTAPFVSVHLPTIASAFNSNVGGLEKEIAELIQSGQIQARIDSGSQVLYKRRANLRSTTFASAMQAGEEYLRSTRALLLRASLQRHDLIQKAPPGLRQGNRGGGGGSGGGGGAGGGGGGGSSASFLPPPLPGLTGCWDDRRNLAGSLPSVE